jgi:hypothetical protein
MAEEVTCCGSPLRSNESIQTTVPPQNFRLWGEFFIQAPPRGQQEWEKFDIRHELTRKGMEKFAADYRDTLSRPA